jgi:hypothetical protein
MDAEILGIMPAMMAETAQRYSLMVWGLLACAWSILAACAGVMCFGRIFLPCAVLLASQTGK